MNLQVDIVSAEDSIFSGVAEAVFAPAEMGEVGIYPRHAPLITRLRPGEIRVKLPDIAEEQSFYVSGGMLEIPPHVVTVLADTALRAKDMDEAKALEAKQHAEQLLKDKHTGIDYAKAQAELAAAVVQLRMIEQLRKKRR
jgi:F-type H+-transporting ATPase subunit epsilon